MAVLAFLPSLIPAYSTTIRLAIVTGGIFLLGIVLATKTRYRRGLKKVPGPFWASISPLDRIITSASGQQFKRHLEYHDKYGPVVRVGPNQVSFSNSDLIPHVYGITSRFYKVCVTKRLSKSRRDSLTGEFPERLLLNVRCEIEAGQAFSDSLFRPG